LGEKTRACAKFHNRDWSRGADAIEFLVSKELTPRSDPGGPKNCMAEDLKREPVQRRKMTTISSTGARKEQHPPSGPQASSRHPVPSSDAADSEAVFAELKRYIGFDAQDAAHLRTLARVVEKHLPAIVDRFHDEIQRHPGTREALNDGPQQVERLRGSLTAWLWSLFSGTYDAAYVQQRTRIGQVHVRVGLPQHYMFGALELIRQELHRVIRDADVAEADAKLESLDKLLALETATMLESYKDTFAERVRESERSAVQERLTQAEHLAKIGQLAASLAHEIKNPLAGISGAVQVIRDATEPDAPHRPILAEILRQINRLDQTVKDLLVYARPAPPRFDRCNLSRVVERLMTVLKREPAMQRVRFEHRTDHRPLPSIEADENKIEQLLMNLVLNAAHASENDGLVTLTTRLTSKGVQLEIEDRGHGMDEQTCQRALEPFFTTKSRGTGLGLPICRRIAESHSGTLTIHSAAGQGTRVCVLLPHLQPARTQNWR
jgi:two-component system sensor histidine kinase HydH